MKIIFLDIDGVLNCKATPNPRRFPYIIDKALLRRLLDLCERSGAQVVLSSTWRYDPAGCFSAKHQGVPFIDITPDFPHRPRREEILSWVSEHAEVTRYAVIDDEDDDLDDLPLFQPSSVTGLTDDIADGVAAYLDGKTDRDMRCNRFVRMMQNVHSCLRGHDG